MTTNGIVTLIGAGPGDPGLITVRGRECLAQADVVIYDRLASPELLRTARPDAERIYVGKASSQHTLSQDEINALLVEKARAGLRVARLKGGDPFVFGRGGEEAQALVAAGIPFEIVPGVTSAIAALAYAGIPVTHRGRAASFAVVTGHRRREAKAAAEDRAVQFSHKTLEPPSRGQPMQRHDVSGKGFRPQNAPGTGAESIGKLELNSPAAGDGLDLDWEALAGVDTLVFLMGVANLPIIVQGLLGAGRNPRTPVALVRWGTTPRQEVVTGNLQDIVLRVQETGLRPPAVTVVGDVVSLRDQLRWFDTRPLFGLRVLVTRTRAQASQLSARLRALGAETVEFPTIEILPPEDWASLDKAVGWLVAYDWVIFTSVNGVRYFWQRLERAGMDARAFAGTRLGAIGPATAGELARRGLRADLMPSQYVAEAILAEIGPVRNLRILLPRADIARPALADGLRAAGAIVDEVAAYRTVAGAADNTAEVRRMLTAGEIDVLTFTSSSTVRNFVAALNPAHPLPDTAWTWSTVTIACIGPVTAQTAQELGLPVRITASEHTIEGLIQALTKHFTGVDII